MPISVDRVKVLVICLLHKKAHSGEGWLMLPVFPPRLSIEPKRCIIIHYSLLLLDRCKFIVMFWTVFHYPEKRNQHEYPSFFNTIDEKVPTITWSVCL